MTIHKIDGKLLKKNDALCKTCCEEDPICKCIQSGCMCINLKYNFIDMVPVYAEPPAPPTLTYRCEERHFSYDYMIYAGTEFICGQDWTAVIASFYDSGNLWIWYAGIHWFHDPQKPNNEIDTCIVNNIHDGWGEYIEYANVRYDRLPGESVEAFCTRTKTGSVTWTKDYQCPDPDGTILQEYLTTSWFPVLDCQTTTDTTTTGTTTTGTTTTGTTTTTVTTTSTTTATTTTPALTFDCCQENFDYMEIQLSGVGRTAECPLGCRTWYTQTMCFTEEEEPNITIILERVSSCYWQWDGYAVTGERRWYIVEEEPCDCSAGFDYAEDLTIAGAVVFVDQTEGLVSVGTGGSVFLFQGAVPCVGTVPNQAPSGPYGCYTGGTAHLEVRTVP